MQNFACNFREWDHYLWIGCDNKAFAVSERLQIHEVHFEKWLILFSLMADEYIVHKG